jgi:acyl-coenzyme A thioesterase PaaI-like protein
MVENFDVVALFKEVLGDNLDDFTLPPGSFSSMQCEIIAFDKVEKSITVTMPVLDFTLNPYNTMQGGFITAALDNAIGPLSLLVAPLNMSRRITTDYRRAITKEIELLYITAQLTETKGRKLFFSAELKDCHGTVYTTAVAENWLMKK